MNVAVRRYAGYIVKMNRRTFSTASLSALLACAGLAATSVIWTNELAVAMQALAAAFKRHLGGTVLVTASLFVIVTTLLVLHPVGRLRLGGQSAQPEFSTFSWLAMLFAAGMGAGLLFWGVAEPILHYQHSPFSSDKANQALALTYLHWALHPWAIYALGSLALAYFSFQQAAPLVPSGPFTRWLAHDVRRGIDALSLLSMMIGMAAALAQGVMQLQAGVQPLLPIMLPPPVQLGVFVAVLLLVYSLSVVTRLGRGIKYLSILTILLAIALMIFFSMFAMEGTVLDRLLAAALRYVELLPEAAFTRLTVEGQPDWSNDWTITYFLSWIAWVPFVAVFIARISYGRTIRGFLLGVMLVPSLFSMVWFAVMGEAAFQSQEASGGLLAAIVERDPSQALYGMLAYFPQPELLLLLVLLLVFVFLVTSADSASYVMAMLAEHGRLDPHIAMRLLWGGILALLTYGVLLGGDGVGNVRALFSVGAILIYFVLVAQVCSLLVALLRLKGNGGVNTPATT